MENNQPVIIAVDAMGGDHAPDSVIAGIKLALDNNKADKIDVKYLIFGDEEKVMPLIKKYGISSDYYSFVHTTGYIVSDEKPSVAVRTGRDSSLWKAIESVKHNEASAIVSSGNTGALMALSKIILGTMPGIHRPALASIMPNRTGEHVMLDLGANTECDTRNLVEFAVMGEAYARAVLKREKPTIGILNIGSEEIKGREELREAAQILRSTDYASQFKGFVESDDLGKGSVDVFVSDGFSGNIALKAVEGTARLMIGLLKDFIKDSFLAKLGAVFFIPVMKAMKKKMNPGNYNGAMLVGLKGISIKSHGGADAFGFSQALRVAYNAVQNDLRGYIATQIEKIKLLTEPEQKKEG